MKASSAKNKGYRFESHLLEVVRRELDKDAHRVAGSGSGADKGDIRSPQYNLEIEAKNAKKTTLLEWWEQTKREHTGENMNVLAIRNPRKPEFEETLLVMDLGDFLNLLKQTKEETEVIGTLSPNMKWELKRLMESIKKVIKLINKEDNVTT